MRILGVDFGLKRVGLAICDPGEALATAYGTLTREGREQCFDEIRQIVDKEGVGAVAVGLPLALDGGETLTTRQARNFAESLGRRLYVPVHMVDERLTSAAAEHDLKEAGLCPKKRKQVLDSQAAVHILETFLNRRSGEPDG